ncbi:MAG TPA: FHA domain-containing protein, partial [Solirubrobacteraceae bacterium]
MAKLIVNPTSSSRREISLSRTLVSIGRDPSNDLVLPDAMVSRRHAVIEYRGSQYYLRDCNSSNGSLVNGDRVSERNLRDGDLVAIGTARLLFRDDLHDEEPGSKVVQHPSSPRLVCPSCQAEYRKGDLFCRQCGSALAPSSPPKVVCTACGTAVLLPARFCNACGTALPRPAGEEPSREVTPAAGAGDAVAAPAPAGPAAEPALQVEPENTPGRPSVEKAQALALAPARAPALRPRELPTRVPRPAL